MPSRHSHGDPTPEAPDPARLDEMVRALIDESRTSCLWFVREDYYPVTLDERVHILRQIERHGDRSQFRRAATLRRWLSHHSSSKPAGS
jgi:hypothetical protein